MVSTANRRLPGRRQGLQPVRELLPSLLDHYTLANVDHEQSESEHRKAVVLTSRSARVAERTRRTLLPR